MKAKTFLCTAVVAIGLAGLLACSGASESPATQDAAIGPGPDADAVAPASDADAGALAPDADAEALTPDADAEVLAPDADAEALTPDADAEVLASGGFLVWKPAPVPVAMGEALRKAVADNGVPVQVVEDLSGVASLEAFEGILICLGMGEESLAFSEFPPAILARLTAYLDQGGRVYLEGGNAWYPNGQSSLQSYFGIRGRWAGPAGPVTAVLMGKAFAFGEDFYPVQDPAFTAGADYLAAIPGTGAVPILVVPSTSSPARTIAREIPGTLARTVGSSIPLAALDEWASGTRRTYLGEILDFLTKGRPDCVTDPYCDDSVLCTLDRCEDRHCLNEKALEMDCGVCLDDRDCPADHGCDRGGACKLIPGLRHDSKDTPLDLAALSSGVYTSTITVPGDDLAQAVSVQLQVLHDSIGELRVTLQHGGMTVVLQDPLVGIGLADWFITADLFVDTCYLDLGAFCLDDLQGTNAGGSWLLTIEDQFPGNGGTLLGWSLFLEGTQQ